MVREDIPCAGPASASLASAFVLQVRYKDSVIWYLWVVQSWFESFRGIRRLFEFFRETMQRIDQWGYFCSSTKKEKVNWNNHDYRYSVSPAMQSFMEIVEIRPSSSYSRGSRKRSNFTGNCGFMKREIYPWMKFWTIETDCSTVEKRGTPIVHCFFHNNFFPFIPSLPYYIILHSIIDRYASDFRLFVPQDASPKRSGSGRRPGDSKHQIPPNPSLSLLVCRKCLTPMVIVPVLVACSRETSVPTVSSLLALTCAITRLATM